MEGTPGDRGSRPDKKERPATVRRALFLHPFYFFFFFFFFFVVFVAMGPCLSAEG